MVAESYDRSLAAVLKYEGGWSDHPADPGGATMKGVTLATYRRYRPGATKADLRKITDAELRRIYRDGYWNKVSGDALPAGLDHAVFDFAVNSGPGRAIPFLQKTLGVKADGKIGPVTLAAVGKVDPAIVAVALCDRRLAWLKTLKTWGTFSKGWSARIVAVKKLAKEMAAADPKPVFIPPPPDIPAPETAPAPASEPGFFLRLRDWFRWAFTIGE